MIGPALEQALAAAGLELHHAEPITGLAVTTLQRATFKLTLRDGRTIKGRRLDAPPHVARIVHVVTALGRPELPRILWHGGTALLETWIDGAPMPDQAGDALVARCGRLLGAIHATPRRAPAGGTAEDLFEPPLDAGGYASLAAWTFDELRRHDVVSAPFAADLCAIAAAHAPAEVEVGYVHGDFCAENLVVRPDGTPAAVDSGSVGVRALDFDLARTWYRWPMSPAQAAAFADGYRHHRDDGSFLAHRPFWTLFALADATLFRATTGAVNAHVPHERLTRLMGELRQRRARA